MTSNEGNGWPKALVDGPQKISTRIEGRRRFLSVSTKERQQKSEGARPRHLPAFHGGHMSPRALDLIRGATGKPKLVHHGSCADEHRTTHDERRR